MTPALLLVGAAVLDEVAHFELARFDSIGDRFVDLRDALAGCTATRVRRVDDVLGGLGCRFGAWHGIRWNAAGSTVRTLRGPTAAIRRLVRV